MNLRIVLFFTYLFSLRILADNNNLCPTTSDGEFLNCLFTLNTTQRCQGSGKKEVNREFSSLLVNMNLRTMEEISNILKNHINSMVLQLYSDSRHACQNSNSPLFFTNRSNLDSHIISPLETSHFVSAGLFQISGSNRWLRVWKNYTDQLNTSADIFQLGDGFNGKEYTKLHAEEQYGNINITEIGKAPEDFFTSNFNDGRDILIPKVEATWKGPFLECNNGNYLSLEVDLPIYALTDCTEADFSKVGFASFEVPLSLIDINQCMGKEDPKLNNCPSNSNCQKNEFANSLSKYSYICVCDRQFFMYNDSMYPEDKTCHKCHPSCFNCTSADPCYTKVLRFVLLAWNTLIMLICVGLIIITIVFSYIWKHESFVSSAPPFLLIILVGSLFMYTSLIVEYFPPNSVTCTLNAWFFYTGFSLAFGSLIIKSWRIIKLYKESNNWAHNIKPPRSIDWHLFLRLLPFIFITIISLIAWTTSKSMPNIESINEQKGQFLYCKHDDWSYLIIVANFFLVVFGILLAIKARTLPTYFSETRDILFSIYNITIVNVICTIVASTLYFYQQDINFVVLFVNLNLGITFMIFIMFRKKVLDVFYDKIPFIKKKPKANVNEDMALMQPQERLRLLDEIKKLGELLNNSKKQVNELQGECSELRSNTENQIVTPVRGMADVETAISIVIDPPDTTVEISPYDLNAIPMYLYEKRDSATESEIHMSMKERNDQYESISSPVSSESTDS